MQVIPTTANLLHQPPYISFLGAVYKSNKDDNTFKCNPLQYTTYYRDRHHLLALPIHAHFETTRYKTKPPLTLNLPNLSLKHHLLWQKVQNDNWRECMEVNCCIPCFHILYMLRILFFVLVCTKHIAAQTCPFAFNTVSCFWNIRNVVMFN